MLKILSTRLGSDLQICSASSTCRSLFWYTVLCMSIRYFACPECPTPSWSSDSSMLCPAPAPYDRIWQLISRKWTGVIPGLIPFVSISGITFLHCLLPRVWKLLFLMFSTVWVVSYEQVSLGGPCHSNLTYSWCHIKQHAIGKQKTNWYVDLPVSHLLYPGFKSSFRFESCIWKLGLRVWGSTNSNELNWGSTTWCVWWCRIKSGRRSS